MSAVSVEYFRKIDEARGYPEAFVNALTKAGWFAALIPQDFGGSGACHGRVPAIQASVSAPSSSWNRRRFTRRAFWRPRADAAQPSHRASPHQARKAEHRSSHCENCPGS